MTTKNPATAEQASTLNEQVAQPLTIAPNSEQKIERISDEKVYEETAKVAAIFWEWRHKIMTHFFAGMAALFALISWLYKLGDGITLWLCIPLILGAIFSYISYLLDGRNKIILEECYRIGKEIDQHAHKGGGVFKFLNDLHYTSGSYTKILRNLYLTTTYILLALSIVIIGIMLNRLV